ncbi:MAG: ferritin-like domain-containing protein, partial [Chthoniobacterales bacterium]|nr:ferritin-like domain-containing protein [Chthoniobacterales bacterium]
ASLLQTNAFKNVRFDFKTNSLNRRQVLELVYTAERTGVGAYLGAIPFFETKTYLQTAGAIQGTEARHTAVIAAVLNKLYGANIAVAPPANVNNGIDSPLAPDDVLAAVSPFIVL